ncbi:hypothetical protein GW17_00062281, partial [Ensete ventricosum]
HMVKRGEEAMTSPEGLSYPKAKRQSERSFCFDFRCACDAPTVGFPTVILEPRKPLQGAVGHGHGQPPCRGGQLQPRPPCKGAARASHPRPRHRGCCQRSADGCPQEGSRPRVAASSGSAYKGGARGGAGRRGGRPLAEWLPTGKGSRRLRRGSSDGVVRVKEG